MGSQNLRRLDTSNGCQDHTALPSALAPFVCAPQIAHEVQLALRLPMRARRCRVHRIPPQRRDDGQRPSSERDGGRYSFDLGERRRRIFFKRRLDTMVDKLPVGQIRTLGQHADRRPLPCRSLRAEVCSCPGRDAALLRCFAEPGPYQTHRCSLRPRLCSAPFRKGYTIARQRRA